MARLPHVLIPILIMSSLLQLTGEGPSTIMENGLSPWNEDEATGGLLEHAVRDSTRQRRRLRRHKMLGRRLSSQGAEHISAAQRFC